MCTCIQCGIGNFRKKKNQQHWKTNILSIKKYICKLKHQKDLERGKIKILLRFKQTRETLSIHAN